MKFKIPKFLKLPFLSIIIISFFLSIKPDYQKIKFLLECIEAKSSGIFPFGCAPSESNILKDVQAAEIHAITKDKRIHFQKSKSDNKAYFHNAIQTIEEPYKNPINRQQIYSKLIALKVLRWSSHWESKDRCKNIKKNLEIKLKKESHELTKINLMSDLGEINHICSEL